MSKPKNKTPVNATALNVMEAAHEYGDWISLVELIELTGLTKPQVQNAIMRIMAMAHEWCGPDGLSERLVRLAPGRGRARRYIRVNRIITTPLVVERTAADMIREALTVDNTLSIADLAKLAHCSRPAACQVRKAYLNNRRLPVKRLERCTRKTERKEPTAQQQARKLYQEDLDSLHTQRLLRQLWPVSGRATA